MHNLKMLTLALLLISLAMTPALAKPHEPGALRDHDDQTKERFAALQQSLGLTTQQQTEIQAVFAANRQERAAWRQATRTNRAELRALVDAEVLDEARLQQLLQEQAELKARKMITQHAARSRVRQILTPEQQEKWAALHQERRRHREARKDAEPSNDNGDR